MNFKSLLNAMKLYDRAPRYFNSIFEDDEMQYMQGDGMNFNKQNSSNADQNQPNKSKINELEKIFGRKLKQTDLQQIGNLLASKLNLKLDRNTKRSKVLLIEWFTKHWQILYPKIYEFNLPQMDLQHMKQLD